ncbi:MAG: hypothetical protein L0387_45770 [Acidobacteria bacterium]|nr:hypothetical protein [Acidobacteriota bacterium]
MTFGNWLGLAVALERLGYVQYAFSTKVLVRSALIALVVGSLLTAVNQYEILLRGPYTSPLRIKVMFNFLVPFLVSSVSAAVNRPKG